jgi:hypothetical protein
MENALELQLLNTRMPNEFGRMPEVRLRHICPASVPFAACADVLPAGLHLPADFGKDLRESGLSSQEATVMTEERAFSDGFDAALHEIGPLFDDWDRLSNDERAEIRAIAPLFVEKLEHLKATVDRC